MNGIVLQDALAFVIALGSVIAMLWRIFSGISSINEDIVRLNETVKNFVIIRERDLQNADSKVKSISERLDNLDTRLQNLEKRVFD